MIIKLKIYLNETLKLSLSWHLFSGGSAPNFINSDANPKPLLGRLKSSNCDQERANWKNGFNILNEFVEENISWFC